MYGTCEVEEGCGSQCGESSCREVDYATALGHWAKIELLKEKVKQRINKQYGEKLDTVADLIAEIVIERSNNVKDLTKKEQQLKSAFEDLKWSS